MKPDYNDILSPLVIAVMVAYNRPVTLEEIVDGVMDIIKYLRDQMDPEISSSVKATGDSKHIHTFRNTKKRQLR
ncbi:uncharacterized protein Dwil_GK19154 [Drosophila willistoni]|uniref:Uncharacterized protein n=1 Tax=Drosophila willistoni TaxID=7260 RepID=B4N3Z7_DROWI|nr:uncharacterized protein LOC6645602 [Drosophila willistoni]EDW79352.1 uncharacterized protein Dwil_GK19154 [Drosophila willistoni]